MQLTEQERKIMADIYKSARIKPRSPKALKRLYRQTHKEF